MPQWEPCSYIMPFEERGGEAGFNFTLLKADEADEKTAINFFLGEPFWERTEKGTERVWLPAADIPELPWKEAGQTWFAWTEVRAVPGKNLQKAREELICFLKVKKEKNPDVYKRQSLNGPGWPVWSGLPVWNLLWYLYILTGRIFPARSP